MEKHESSHRHTHTFHRPRSDGPSVSGDSTSGSGNSTSAPPGDHSSGSVPLLDNGKHKAGGGQLADECDTGADGSNASPSDDFFGVEELAGELRDRKQLGRRGEVRVNTLLCMIRV